jgi:hypothetical protein
MRLIYPFTLSAFWTRRSNANSPKSNRHPILQIRDKVRGANLPDCYLMGDFFLAILENNEINQKIKEKKSYLLGSKNNFWLMVQGYPRFGNL